MTSTPDISYAYRPHMVRSMRRALKRMVADGALMTDGNGGPGDPFRYVIHPFVAVMYEDHTGETLPAYRRGDRDGAPCSTWMTPG
jgi:hypothetical protein